MKKTWILALTIAAFATAASAQKPCSKSDEVNAQKAIDRISTWANLGSTWKTYRHCDTGAIGEQFTDALLRLIIDWKNVNQLADAMKDADYHAFVVNHLKSPEAKSDAPDVYSRAKANCPKGLEDFCKDIAAAARDAAPPPAPAAELPQPMQSIRPPAAAPPAPPKEEKK